MSRMRDYSLPEGFWLSLGSKRFYQSVPQTWRARVYFYLLLLCFVATLPSFVRFYTKFQRDFASLRPKIVAQMPPLSIVNGQLETPSPIPYTIRLGDKPHEAVVIDTSGKIRSLSDTPATVLLTKTDLYVRASATEIRQHSLSKFNTLKLDQKALNQWMDITQRYAPLIVFPFIFIGHFLRKLLEALLLTLMAVFLLRILEGNLRKTQIFALAVVALTPSVLWSAFLEMANQSFRGQGFLAVWISIGYFIYAINAATDTPVEENQG